MLQFDPSEISNWASLPDADHQLPELVRRLILATVTELSKLSMPIGSAVRLPGWDGLLTTETGNAWVPAGDSAWEFSCQSDVSAKANEDYRKRTEQPLGVAHASSALLFVTPRQWGGKRNWVEELRAEGKWADVHAFDCQRSIRLVRPRLSGGGVVWASDRQTSSLGYVTLDEWWENWATAPQPHISPALVLSGRQESVAEVAEWIRQPAVPYYVKGQTRDEVIAFVAASALTSREAWGAVLRTKALVVRSEDAWNSLVRHPSPLVLVRAFDGNVSSQAAASRGHHVITPLHESEDPGGNGIELPRLGRDETVTALTEMGLSETTALPLMRKTARKLPIMRRFLIDEAGGQAPDWVTVDPQNPLPLLVLIGQWDESNDADKEAVAKITGRPYEKVVREVVALAQGEDAPLTKVGSTWRFLSHEEAWHLLAARLASVDVDRFVEEAVRILSAEPTEYELPYEERHLTAVRGEGVPHSDLLRKGIATTLALMGNQGERARNVEDATYSPVGILRRVLTDDKGWQIWATLDRDLPTLAEAAPEAVLEAIERGLAATPSPFEALFAHEGGALFSGAKHTGLLWALERLTWAPEHFARAANAFARLDLMDPGGRAGNRPAVSLAGMFLPGFRWSETSDDDRLTVLGALLRRFPEPGWNASIDSYRSNHINDRQPPSWRPWGQGEMQQPTWAERDASVEKLEHLLLEHVGRNIERWEDLVGIISGLSQHVR